MGKKGIKMTEKTKVWLKRIALIIYDVIAVVVASAMGLLVRFDFSWSSITMGFVDNLYACLPFFVIVTIAIFYGFKLYTSLWKYAGATELVEILMASLASTLATVFIAFVRHGFDFHALPRSFYPTYGVALWVLVLICRYAHRAVYEINARRLGRNAQTNVLIIGAGEAGNALIKEIRASSHVVLNIVGVIDDDKSKRGNYVHGIKVIGDRNDIARIVKEKDVKEIIYAIPAAPAGETRAILDICKETGAKVKRIPGIYQLVNGEVSVAALRDVDIEDLLGRDPVKVDISSIMGYVEGHTVMVTGGGGSIGSELCRQLAAHKPSRLIIFDIYENSTYDIQNEIRNKYPELDLVVLIGSVRNTRRIEEIFNTYRPDIVYHAAAHKHVPLMEDSPNEAVKNNVLGTWKLVQMADKYKVKRFVLISTDKAVNPTNIMGATKRICEMIVQTYNNRSKTEFVAVRFGNVLGSNGSVIPLFKRQILQGGPVTVTHPDIIRYFMTIPEAVTLVLQAGAYAKGGEIFVLDMGEPVRIADLARNLILLTGHKPDEDIKIVYTGLRPGEKLYEEMLMDEEGLKETPNHQIHIGKPIEFDEEKFLTQLQELADYVVAEPTDIREKVAEITGTYNYKKEV